MGNIEKQIQHGIIAAMKTKNQYRLSALRNAKAALTNESVKGKTFHELTDEEEIKVIQKLIKQQKESAEIYTAAGRPELAEKELQEVQYLDEFVPEQLSDDEILVAIADVINETGASGMKDMGKVMGIITKRLAGKAEGSTISKLVRNALS